MRLRKIVAGVALVVAAAGFVPATASAADCVDDTGVGIVDDKVVGDTCTDCGWMKIRGKEYYLFACD
jgi:hypothetical protein